MYVGCFTLHGALSAISDVKSELANITRIALDLECEISSDLDSVFNLK